MIKKSNEEIKKCIENQDKLISTKELPYFAPLDGICWNCKRNIYQNYQSCYGCDGRSFITGCPHCHKSFCD